MGFKLLMLPPQTEITHGWARRLAATLPELQVVESDGPQHAQAEIVDADGVFGTLTPDLLARATRLRWLQAPQAAPPAGFYFPELVAHRLVATNFREIFNDHIGAHIMAFVFAFARGFHYYLPQQMRREWKKPPEDHGVVDLHSATALIVGLGGIGTEAARLCRAAGMRVAGTDARRTAAPEGVEMHPPGALDALLPLADFVIATVPHTPSTEGMFNRARFARMRRGAFFINIGRGRTTRLDDLAAALEAGEIAGAGLDVYEIEPLPARHPLWTMPGVLMTPHMAGYGPHLNERRYEILLHNARAMLNGGPLRNVVDKASWF
jgi:phosphoglycerate dehydrogenase-like enzyme